MPNLMLRLAYVGSGYSGWQVQPGVPTVQGTLELALERILGERVRVTGCCRTDAGVHAQDYVANFRTDRRIDEGRLLRALNALLPKDIGVYEVRAVPEDFNARYSVRGKVYLYRIWNAPTRNPFLYPFSWQVPVDLDLQLVEDALGLLSGEHDFRGFAKLEEEKNTSLRLEAWMEVRGELVEIRFRATHFLRYMVRRITAAAVRVGTGKMDLPELEGYLKGRHCPFTAPARGLTLERVLL